MSMLGSDFDGAMRQLRQTLAVAETTLADLRAAIAKLNALLDRIQVK